ncbi:FAD binding domain in molybdopterin dehydrogenase [Peptostreptococcaceae bacterium AS15]|nr:FAD binding domain in molybdopterin dehydrogenase [Peptostreptococcaceae bacterium AS15]
MSKFYQPTNKLSLKKALALKDENTLMVAGATDVMVEIRQKNIFDKDFIDLTKLKGFEFIKDYKTKVEIGSITKIQDIADSSVIREFFPSLSFASRHIGSRQIRNRATIGGNVANASQSADTIPVLCALKASVVLFNSKGEERTLLVEDFVQGRGKTAIQDDEAVYKFIIPKISKYNYFAKLGSRKEVTISKINCAMMFEIKDELIVNSSIYLGAIGVKPVRGELFEEYFINKNINDIDLDYLFKLGYETVENAIPNRQSKYYKRKAVCGVIDDIVTKLRCDHEI